MITNIQIKTTKRGGRYATYTLLGRNCCTFLPAAVTDDELVVVYVMSTIDHDELGISLDALETTALLAHDRGGLSLSPVKAARVVETLRRSLIGSMAIGYGELWHVNMCGLEARFMQLGGRMNISASVIDYAQLAAARCVKPAVRPRSTPEAKPRSTRAGGDWSHANRWYRHLVGTIGLTSDELAAVHELLKEGFGVTSSKDIDAVMFLQFCRRLELIGKPKRAAQLRQQIGAMI